MGQRSCAGPVIFIKGRGGGAVQAQLPEKEFLALNLFTEGSSGEETSSWGQHIGYVISVADEHVLYRLSIVIGSDLALTIGMILLDFSLSVKAATLIFISGCGSAISSAKKGKSGFIYSLVKS